MKNLLTIAIVLSSATAFATRARVTALGGGTAAPHIIDTAVSSPDQILPLGESLTIESGSTGTDSSTVGAFTSADTKAAGSLYKTVGDGKLGVVLGHQDSMIFANRAQVANTTPVVAGLTDSIDAQQNPLEVSYALRLADFNAGFGLIYSNYDNKTPSAEEKESSMGLRAGISNSMFYGNAKLILTDKWSNAAFDYKGKLGFDLKAGYYFGDLSVHANIASTGFKISTPAADVFDGEKMTIAVKLIDTIKKDSNFFYGIGLTNTTSKESKSDFKETTMNLPLIIGLETPANSWLTFRGSITQDVLISNDKAETAGVTSKEFNPGANTTNFAAGVGVVFNKLTVDGSIMTGGTQTINSGNLLSTVGVSYMF